MNGRRGIETQLRWSWDVTQTLIQGSSFLATLGFAAEARWASERGKLSRIQIDSSPLKMSKLQAGLKTRAPSPTTSGCTQRPWGIQEAVAIWLSPAAQKLALLNGDGIGFAPGLNFDPQGLSRWRQVRQLNHHFPIIADQDCAADG